MAARKLQSEIDRTLKRVAEGVEVFEGLYEKLQLSTNQTQKEKLEADLKTQIKKLQRLRDQIKTWIQSNDIKDKKPLTDNRRLIETQMERFKAIEKEMKTKAFSKEGLILAAKMDPSEKAKMEMSNWLAGMVDELSRQIEASEAEIEQLAGQGKKSKKGGSGAGAERTAELETQNERRSWHVSRLEILHRMLENGTLETEAIDEIKEDISYYVESNAEEDFEEDEGIYDDFNLEEQEEEFGLQQNDDMQSSHDSASVAEDPPKTPVKENATAKRRDSELEAVKRDELKKPARRQTSESSSKEKAVPSANFPPAAKTAGSAAPASIAASVVSPPRAPAAAALPPIRYAAAAAAAVAAPAISSVSPSTISSAAPTTSADTADDVSSVAPSETQEDGGVTRASPAPSQGPGASNASVSQHASNSNSASISSTPAPEAVVANGSSAADTESSNFAATSSSIAPPPGLGGSTASPSPAFAHSPAASHLSAQPADDQRSQVDGEVRGASNSSSSAPTASGTESDFQPAQLAASSAAAGVVQPVGGGAGTSQQQQAAQRQHGTDARLPGSLADLVSSFESAKQKSMRRDRDLTAVHKSLESSFMNVPEPLDSEKPKYYIPKNPFPAAAYYPQTPASVFDNPALYSKFDVDTLFYIFYYQQGTYHQYLAARELKKQSWRFHKQYLTWFQRHSEPQAITDEYEQGVYVYFDWEGSWCQRKKSDFRFEYRWLEEN